MTRKITMALALWAGMATGAAAQTVDCADAMTQVDLTVCAAADLAQADAALNEAYAQARSTMRALDDGLSPAQAGAEEALRTAQRSWITFRDQACAAEGFMVRGGTAEPMVVLSCKARLTETRTGDLMALATGLEQ